MHHATPLITTIVGGLVLAFILGMLANKLRISPLVGYLLAGVLAGPFTPGFVADTKLAPELAELGVILLMFGVGLHFSLKDLMAVKAIAIPGAIAQIAVATLLGMALSAVLGWSLMTGIVFGLCLSTASTVVLLRALEERQLIDSQRGQIAIGWLIVEDLVMVLTLVLLPAVAGMMEQGDVGFATLAVDMGITIGKVIAFIAIMMLVGRRLVPWIMARSAATGSRELFTLSVLALALGIAFGAVELFDVSFALGAFFAGMVLNESELSHRAAHDTLPLRDAFAVLFFVSVGMLFDPLILIQQPLAVLATLAIILFGKSLAAFFLVRLFGHSQRTALTIAASLAQIGEFAFILAGLGMALDLLPQAGQNLVLAGAILSIMLNPVLFALLVGKWLTAKPLAAWGSMMLAAVCKLAALYVVLVKLVAPMIVPAAKLTAVTAAFMPVVAAITAWRSSGLTVGTLITFTEIFSLARISAAANALDTITPLANTTASVPSRIVYNLPISNLRSAAVRIGRSLRLIRM